MAAPKCGKCGSGNVYWDNDGVGTVLACRKCGHRTPPPIVFNEEEEEDNTMPKKPCENCQRVLWVVKERMCSVCSKAAEGKEGPEREAALAEVKERILKGELRTGSPAKKKARTVADDKPRAKKRGASCELSLEAAKKVVPGRIKIVGMLDGQEIRVPLHLAVEIGIRITDVSQAKAIA